MTSSTATGKRKQRGVVDESPAKPTGSSSTTRASTRTAGGDGLGVGVASGRVTRRSAAAASGPAKVVHQTSKGPGRPRNEADSEGRDGTMEAGPSTRMIEGIGSQKPIKRLRKGSQSPFNLNQAEGSTLETHLPLIPPIPRHLPYPIGLTPFRYTCLHPAIPNPPPGDPLNPKWKPYDPNHVSHLGPLPDSVRALSMLGQDMGDMQRRFNPREGGLILDPALQVDPGGSSRGGGGPNVIADIPPYDPYSAKSRSSHQHQNNNHPPIYQEDRPPNMMSNQQSDVDPVLDPALAALPHPPPVPQRSTVVDTTRPIDPSDPSFDINTFFESATYESISALLAAGDDVGGGETSGQTG